MATYTPTFQFKLPASTDLADIPGDYNPNFQKIDNLLNYVTPNVTYTIRIDKDNSDPDGRIEYEDDAIGFTGAHMDFANNRFDYGSWGKAWFVTGNTPWMVKFDGTPDYELNPNDYSKKKADLTPSDYNNPEYDGNAMCKRPLVWLAEWESPGASRYKGSSADDPSTPRYEYISVSNTQNGARAGEVCYVTPIDAAMGRTTSRVTYYAFAHTPIEADAGDEKLKYYWSPIYRGSLDVTSTQAGNKTTAIAGSPSNTAGNRQDGILRSLSGQRPSVSMVFSQHMITAKNNEATDGTNVPITTVNHWNTRSWADITLENALLFIMSKTDNGQAAFGEGNNDYKELPTSSAAIVYNNGSSDVSVASDESWGVNNAAYSITTTNDINELVAAIKNGRTATSGGTAINATVVVGGTTYVDVDAVKALFSNTAAGKNAEFYFDAFKTTTVTDSSSVVHVVFNLDGSDHLQFDDSKGGGTTFGVVSGSIDGFWTGSRYTYIGEAIEANYSLYRGVEITGSEDMSGQFYGSNEVGRASRVVKIFHSEVSWGDQWDRIVGIVSDAGNIKVKMYETLAANDAYNVDGSGYDEAGVVYTGSWSGSNIKSSRCSVFGRVPEYSSGTDYNKYQCDRIQAILTSTRIPMVRGYLPYTGGYTEKNGGPSYMYFFPFPNNATGSNRSIAQGASPVCRPPLAIANA